MRTKKETEKNSKDERKKVAKKGKPRANENVKKWE